MAVIVSLLIGLGIFLFGMRFLEHSLEQIGSRRIHQWLARSTSHPLSSVASGTVVTAILQSSSMVSLIVLAFASAGMIPLFNAVGVILGANLGTTFTGWIVATIGFKLDLEAMALPLFGIAALVQVFSKKGSRQHALAGIMVGLGLLIFGLALMKDAVEGIPDILTDEWLSKMNAPMFLLTGILMTALIQSSSAMTMIALTALNTGLIDLTDAAALVVGADIGTTSTTALGSLRGSVIAKQLALAHVIYNLSVDAFAFLVMIPLLPAGLELLGIQDPLYGLVLFHSSFNLIGLFVFVPLLKPYSHWLSGFFHESDQPVTRYLHKTNPVVLSAAKVALNNELKDVIRKAIALNARNLKINLEALAIQQEDRECLIDQFDSSLSFEERYLLLKHLEDAVHHYLSQAKPSTDFSLARYSSCVRNAVYAAKTLKDVREDLVRFRHATPQEKGVAKGEGDAETQQLIKHAEELMRMFEVLIELVEQPHNSHFRQTRLSLAKDLNEKAHAHLHEAILLNLSQQSRDDKSDLSSLLNANREIWHSNVNLINAIGDWVEIDEDCLKIAQRESTI